MPRKEKANASLASSILQQNGYSTSGIIDFSSFLKPKNILSTENHQIKPLLSLKPVLEIPHDLQLKLPKLSKNLDNCFKSVSKKDINTKLKGLKDIYLIYNELDLRKVHILKLLRSTLSHFLFLFNELFYENNKQIRKLTLRIFYFYFNAVHKVMQRNQKLWLFAFLMFCGDSEREVSQLTREPRDTILENINQENLKEVLNPNLLKLLDKNTANQGSKKDKESVAERYERLRIVFFRVSKVLITKATLLNFEVLLLILMDPKPLKIFNANVVRLRIEIYSSYSSITFPALPDAPLNTEQTELGESFKKLSLCFINSFQKENDVFAAPILWKNFIKFVQNNVVLFWKVVEEKINFKKLLFPSLLNSILFDNEQNFNYFIEFLNLVPKSIYCAYQETLELSNNESKVINILKVRVLERLENVINKLPREYILVGMFRVVIHFEELSEKSESDFTIKVVKLIDQLDIHSVDNVLNTLKIYLNRDSVDKTLFCYDLVSYLRSGATSVQLLFILSTVLFDNATGQSCAEKENILIIQENLQNIFAKPDFIEKDLQHLVYLKQVSESLVLAGYPLKITPKDLILSNAGALGKLMERKKGIDQVDCFLGILQDNHESADIINTIFELLSNAAIDKKIGFFLLVELCSLELIDERCFTQVGSFLLEKLFSIQDRNTSEMFLEASCKIASMSPELFLKCLNAEEYMLYKYLVLGSMDIVDITLVSNLIDIVKDEFSNPENPVLWKTQLILQALSPELDYQISSELLTLVTSSDLKEFLNTLKSDSFRTFAKILLFDIVHTKVNNLDILFVSKFSKEEKLEFFITSFKSLDIKTVNMELLKNCFDSLEAFKFLLNLSIEHDKPENIGRNVEQNFVKFVCQKFSFLEKINIIKNLVDWVIENNATKLLDKYLIHCHRVLQQISYSTCTDGQAATEADMSVVSDLINRIMNAILDKHIQLRVLVSKFILPLLTKHVPNLNLLLSDHLKFSPSQEEHELIEKDWKQYEFSATNDASELSVKEYLTRLGLLELEEDTEVVFKSELGSYFSGQIREKAGEDSYLVSKKYEEDEVFLVNKSAVEPLFQKQDVVIYSKPSKSKINALQIGEILQINFHGSNEPPFYSLALRTTISFNQLINEGISLPFDSLTSTTATEVQTLAKHLLRVPDYLLKRITVDEFKRIDLEDQLKVLSEDLKKARQSKDVTQSKNLMKQHNDVVSKLKVNTSAQKRELMAQKKLKLQQRKQLIQQTFENASALKSAKLDLEKSGQVEHLTSGIENRTLSNERADQILSDINFVLVFCFSDFKPITTLKYFLTLYRYKRLILTETNSFEVAQVVVFILSQLETKQSWLLQHLAVFEILELILTLLFGQIKNNQTNFLESSFYEHMLLNCCSQVLLKLTEFENIAANIKAKNLFTQFFLFFWNMFSTPTMHRNFQSSSIIFSALSKCITILKGSLQDNDEIKELSNENLIYNWLDQKGPTLDMQEEFLVSSFEICSKISISTSLEKLQDRIETYLTQLASRNGLNKIDKALSIIAIEIKIIMKLYNVKEVQLFCKSRNTFQSLLDLSFTCLFFLLHNTEEDIGATSIASGADISTVTNNQVSRLLKLDEAIFSLLQQFPSLARKWVLHLNPKVLFTKAEINEISSYIKSKFCKKLIQNELSAVSKAINDGILEEYESLEDLTLNDLEDSSELFINVKHKQNTITLLYKKDDSFFELDIIMKSDYPLSGYEIVVKKQMGINKKKIRLWSLQLLTLMNKNGGGLLESIEVIRENIKREFSNIEPCVICYMVVNMEDNSIPRKSCNTCNNKFHSKCLNKWHKTSNQNVCPLCKQII